MFEYLCSIGLASMKRDDLRGCTGTLSADDVVKGLTCEQIQVSYAGCSQAAHSSLTVVVSGHDVLSLNDKALLVGVKSVWSV